MTDLNELLKDWKSKRLAYNEVNRASLEALFTGIVDELEALKARYEVTSPQVTEDEVNAMLERTIASKRGPGRPPKAEAA